MISVGNGKQIGFIGHNKIYIGRANRYFNLKESPLHNPFKVSKTVSRSQAIALYKQHIWKSIKAMRDGLPLDPIVIELINIARVEKDIEVILVCYCKPLACHGDVILAAINWLKTQDWFVENWI